MNLPAWSGLAEQRAFRRTSEWRKYSTDQVVKSKNGSDPGRRFLVEDGRMQVLLTSFDSTYRVPIYGRFWSKTRHRGIGDPERAGNGRAARLRNRAPHRAANARQASVHAGVPVSAAVPDGKTRLGARHLATQRPWPSPPVLPPDAHGKEKTLAIAPGMVRTLSRSTPTDQGGRCLIGTNSSASTSRGSTWRHTSGAKSSKNSPPISTKPSWICASEDLPKRTPLRAVSTRCEIGTLFAETFRLPEERKTP